MMKLAQAEQIADQPGEFGEEDIKAALAYLTSPRMTARQRNVHNERSIERYENRLERLQGQLEAIRNADEARLVY